MKSFPAGVFKAKCLSLMDDVKNKREALVITKHGQPIAKLVPIGKAEVDEIYGFLKGKVILKDDCIAPALSPKEWGSLW